MSKRIGLQRMLDKMDSQHYVEHPQHGRESVSQLRAELASFEANAPADPILYAYDIRDQCSRWYAHFLNIIAWSGQMLEKDRQGIAIEEVS